MNVFASRQGGPVWYAKYRLPDGRQVQRKIGPAWSGARGLHCALARRRLRRLSRAHQDELRGRGADAEARPCHGRDEVMQFLAGYVEPWSGYDYALQDLFEVGDDQVLRKLLGWLNSARQRGGGVNVEFLATVAVIAPDPPAKLYVDALGLPLLLLRR